MSKRKLFKYLGFAVSGIVAIGGFIGSIISEKQQSLEMEEKINEIVEQKMAEKDEEDEES